VLTSTTSKVADEYLRECVEPRSRLLRAVDALRLPPIHDVAYGATQLDRPLFVPGERIHAFADDVTTLLGALTRLPAALHHGDVAAFCARLGTSPRLTALLTRHPELPLPVHARADAYHDGTGFRLLELKVGSEPGGVDAAQANRAWLGVPAFADFAERHGLEHVDTAARLAATLRRAAADVTAREPVVALVEARHRLAAHELALRSLQEAMAAQGLTLLLGEIQELGRIGRKITLRGRPLDVVLRHARAGDLADDPAAAPVLDALARSHTDRGTVLFTPLLSGVFGSTAALALLHDPAVREVLSDAERGTVDRVVPWTARVSDALHDGAAAELLDRIRAERADLVLKPGLGSTGQGGYGGQGTVMGSEVSDEEWLRQLAQRRHGDDVVQRRVRPATEPVVDPRTGEAEDWAAAWGVFVDDAGYAGSVVRALRPQDGPVVSDANAATRGACVFTTP